MLVPLYLLVAADLKLPGIRAVALLVTIYGVAYCLFSYVAGVLADRMNRRNLLAIGLLTNALVVIGIGLSRRYELLVVLVVLGGLCGTLFHPAANALIPEHFPGSPGMAIGLLGIGAGIGFYAGPQYAGWRAQSATWHWGWIADWQRPFIELGFAGIVGALLFFLTARETSTPHRRRKSSARLGTVLRRRVIIIAIVLGLRDFVGIAALSLSSVYLLKAQHRTSAQAGFVLGAMTLLGVIGNPLAVWLTGGARRLPALTTVLILSAISIALVPLAPAAWTLAALCVFQTLQLGSYAISDAAMLERVSPVVRGRVVGLFLTLAGTFAYTGPWLMGLWTDSFGSRGDHPAAYLAPYITLGIGIAVAAFSVPVIARLGEPDPNAIEPITEISPATMEPAM